MKFRVSKPSLKKSIKSRTSLKKVVRNKTGMRAPRGTGWLKNPEKAVKQKVYNRTTFRWSSIFKSKKSRSFAEKTTNQETMRTADQRDVKDISPVGREPETKRRTFWTKPTDWSKRDKYLYAGLWIVLLIVYFIVKLVE